MSVANPNAAPPPKIRLIITYKSGAQFQLIVSDWKVERDRDTDELLRFAWTMHSSQKPRDVYVGLTNIESIWKEDLA